MGRFPLAAAGCLTRLEDGSYAWAEPVALELGGVLVDEGAGYRAECDWPGTGHDSQNIDVRRWVERAQQRILLRRCRPMIARLRKELSERIAREQAAQAVAFRDSLCEAHHADAGDGAPWAGIYYGGPRRARELAVDLEIWNALQ